MKVSIVIPVLNSHEVVRRQLLHFHGMDLPDDVEIIYVDDGSDPPIEYPEHGLRNFRIHRTHDTRPWTWALARNAGARMAVGEHLTMTDLDYVITRRAIEDIREFKGDYMGFRREFGILDEAGLFSQDLDTLVRYGFPRERYALRRFNMPAHPNNFTIRRELFLAMGGYREDRVGLCYPQGEDNYWKKTRKRWVAAGKFSENAYRPTLYMFPNGKWCVGGDVDTNPFGLFHMLSRKSPANPFYNEAR